MCAWGLPAGVEKPACIRRPQRVKHPSRTGTNYWKFALSTGLVRSKITGKGAPTVWVIHENKDHIAYRDYLDALADACDKQANKTAAVRQHSNAQTVCCHYGPEHTHAVHILIWAASLCATGGRRGFYCGCGSERDPLLPSSSHG